MNAKTITIRTGRTIPHPLKSYSNISTSVEIGVDVDPAKPLEGQLDELRIKCEQVVHTHQEQVVESLRRGTALQTMTHRISQLETELEVLKKQQADNAQGLLFGTTEISES